MKLVKLRFGVVVYYTLIESIILLENKIEYINKIIKENNFITKGYRIDDII
jgi:hypothetical protein